MGALVDLAEAGDAGSAAEDAVRVVGQEVAARDVDELALEDEVAAGPFADDAAEGGRFGVGGGRDFATGRYEDGGEGEEQTVHV